MALPSHQETGCRGRSGTQAHMTASVLLSELMSVHKALWDRVCFRDGERGLNAMGQTCMRLRNPS